MGSVTFDAIMVQFQRMDARLDTLCDELCQLNTRVGYIAKRQACLGSFVEFPSPSLKASEDDSDDDDDEDGDASTPSDDKMST